MKKQYKYLILGVMAAMLCIPSIAMAGGIKIEKYHHTWYKVVKDMGVWENNYLATTFGCLYKIRDYDALDRLCNKNSKDLIDIPVGAIVDISKYTYRGASYEARAKLYRIRICGTLKWYCVDKTYLRDRTISIEEGERCEE